MTGTSGRFSTLIKARVNSLLDAAEDPAEILDESYRVQQESVQQVKAGITEVVAAKKRLQRNEGQLQRGIVDLDTQARQAIGRGDDALARTALERKNVAQTELQSLDRQIATLEDHQTMLTDSERKLRVKVEAYRTQKEVIKAEYSAAEAHVRISGAATGVGEEMADLDLAMQRVLIKSEDMKARADAVSELDAGSTFADLTALSTSGDDVDRRLSELSSSAAVDGEFAKLKAELAPGTQGGAR